MFRILVSNDTKETYRFLSCKPRTKSEVKSKDLTKYSKIYYKMY